MPEVDVRGEPWLTEGAIRFLEAWLRPHHRVLEFGGGASTVWFSRRCFEIVSYDQDPNWQAIARGLCDPKCDATQHRWDDGVPDRLLAEYGPESFDLVLVDTGVEEQRQGCLRRAIPLLRPNGVLMADNADTGWVLPILSELHERMPDWDYTISTAWHLDRFGFGGGGWSTAWWQRPGPNQPAIWLKGAY